MIQAFVDRFIGAKDSFLEELKGFQGDYDDLVRMVVDTISVGYGDPDSGRIHKIDDGDYQGTLIFVIAAKGYQPSDYWYVTISYGSCSGCDTLQAALDESDPESKAKQLWTLALHVVQRMKSMDDSK